MVLAATVPDTLISTVVSLAAVVVAMVVTVVMGRPTLTPSFQLAALYFIVNWASDQNTYRAAVMVAKVATVVMGVAIKVMATSKLAE